MRKNFLLLGFALIFLGIFSRAVSIEGSCDSTSVQCDLRISSIDVFNDSAYAQTFIPHASGEVGEWVRVLPEKLLLGPGESGIFEVYTIAVCYAVPGDYSALITVSGAGEEDSVSCDIGISQGHFLDIGLTPVKRTVTQCEQAEYKISLDNRTIVPNQDREFVSLSVSGVPREWVSLEKEQLIVRKGHSEEVGLSIKAPCETDLSEYNFEVRAELFNPDFFSTANGVFEISQGQALEVVPFEGQFDGLAKPFLACIDEENFYELEFKNTGKQPDEISLQLVSAPDWVKLDQQSISLDLGESKKVRVVFEKTDAGQKEYMFQIAAKSQKFNFEKTIDLRADLKDCYSIVVEKLQGEESVCNEDKPVYLFGLQNNGEKEITFNAAISGLDSALSETELSLKPGQSKELTASIGVLGLGSQGKVVSKDISAELLLDASLSMNVELDGKKKLDIAKDSINSFLNSISEINLGLRAFGNKPGCADSTLLVPVSLLDAQDIRSKMTGVLASGETPLAKTIIDASGDFSAGKENYIILVSDGKESCSGDIEKAARVALDRGIKVFAIGFDIDETGKAQLEKITSMTFGEYFDASNSDELVESFSKISKELEIELPKESQKNFTLKLDSQNFHFEKDFPLNISDCYNILVSVPDASLCRLIKSQGTFSVTNLGSKEQTLSIVSEPSWALTDHSVTVMPGEEKLIPLLFSTPVNASETQVNVIVSSQNSNESDAGNLSYLDNETCYGFDMATEAQFEGRIGEGERRKIIFSNRGQAPMEILIQSDMPWVYFEPEQVLVEKGKTGFVNFYITPPFDFMGETKTTVLRAVNGFGFERQKELALTVTGPTFGLVPANITVLVQKAQSADKNDTRTIFVEFFLTNESDQPVEIDSITAKDRNASFDVYSKKLAKSESTKVLMTSRFPSDANLSNVSVGIEIHTSEGIFNRAVEFSVDANTTVVSGPPSPPTGLFAFSNFYIAVIAAIVFVILGVLFYSMVSRPNQGAPKEKSSFGLTAEKPVVEEKKSANAKKTVNEKKIAMQKKKAKRASK